jgi:tetratricopeptide (TPR) repeat protein
MSDMNVTRQIFLVGAVLLGLVSTSLADGKKAAKADEQARAYFRVEAFEDAAREFIRAYEFEAKPTRLYNAGLSYEKAGRAQAASDLYARYLAVEKEGGSKAVEAKARKTALDLQLAEEAKASEEALAKEARTRAVKAKVDAANASLRAGDYADAATHFDGAYKLSKSAEYVFDRAEAERLAGKRTEALASYRLYRRLDPEGINLAEAKRRQSELEAQIVSPKAGGSEPAPAGAIDAQLPEDAPAAKSKEGLSWGWIGLGAGVLAAGLATDLIPSSGDNGKLDGLDFAPVALYGLGGYFVYEGVF